VATTRITGIGTGGFSRVLPAERNVQLVPAPLIAKMRRQAIATGRVLGTALPGSRKTLHAGLVLQPSKGTLYQSRRGLAFKEKVTPVDLSFDVTQPKEVTAAGQSLVICHGLLWVYD